MPSREFITELGREVAPSAKLTPEPCRVVASVILGELVALKLFLVYVVDIGLEVLVAELSDPAEDIDLLVDVCVLNDVAVNNEWVMVAAGLYCVRSDVVTEAGDVEPKLEDCLRRVVIDETVSSVEEGETLIEDDEALLDEGEGAPSQTPEGNGMCIASGAFLGRKPALKGLFPP